jgi:hypothetical protein
MNFQSISYGFGRVGSNPADDGAMRFFAFSIDVSGRDLVLWLFLNIFLKFGSVVGARLVRSASEFRGKVAKRGV